MSSLSRHRDFRRLWAGQSVSSLGTQLGALHFAALVFLNASPGQMGLLAAASGAPVVVLGLWAGAFVDRVPRRPLLVACDAARAVVFGVVGIAAFRGSLTMPVVYSAALVAGSLTVVFEVAYRSYVPSLVGPASLVDANAKLTASSSVAEALGPAAGAAAVGSLGAPVTLVADAASYAFSAAAVGSIRSTEPQPQRDAQSRTVRDVAEGLRHVATDRILRALAASNAWGSFFGGFWAALYGLFVVDVLGLPVVMAGVFIGAGGAASLLGAVVTGRITSSLGVGRAIVASRAVIGVAALAIPAVRGPVLFVVGVMIAAQCTDALWTTADVAELSLRQAVAPGRLLGRVNSLMHLLDVGLVPVGALVAGALAQSIGVRATLWIAASGSLTRVLWLVGLRTVRELPAATG